MLNTHDIVGAQEVRGDSDMLSKLLRGHSDFSAWWSYHPDGRNWLHNVTFIRKSFLGLFPDPVIATRLPGCDGLRTSLRGPNGALDAINVHLDRDHLAAKRCRQIKS